MRNLNAVRIETPESSDLYGLKQTLEAAKTRMKFYGESLTLSWLEALIEEVNELETNEEATRETSFEEGYEEGKRESQQTCSKCLGDLRAAT